MGCGTAPCGASSLMEQSTPAPRCAHWRPEFDRLLQTVRGSGLHGQLVDIRDPLRHAIGLNHSQFGALLTVASATAANTVSQHCLIRSNIVRPMVKTLH